MGCVRVRRVVSAAVLLCVTAPAVQACTDPHRPSSPAAEARELSTGERQTLARAEKLLTRDCMRREGFSFWVTDQPPRSGDELFPYVVDDEQWAASHGYGRDILERREELAADNPNQRYFRSLSAPRRSAAVMALNGREPVGLEAEVPGMGTVRHSDQGCEAQAQRTLYTDLPRWYQVRKVTEALDIQVRSAVVNDQRFGKSVQRWSGCMRAAGYAYASPPEARKGFLRTADPEKSDAGNEIRTAVAEARCADSSGLSEQARALERSHRQRINEQYATEVADRTALEHQALPRARDIVSRG
jgi:hypothetical protein